MTMRSAPPASSPLAERPVPAPAPMIGSPRARMAWKRERMLERGMRGMPLSSRSTAAEAAAEQAAEFRGDLRRELRIVDVQRQPDQPARSGLPHGRLQRPEQLFVGVGIGERTAGCVERRHTAFGQEEAYRTVHEIETLTDPASDADVLLRRRAHQ